MKKKLQETNYFYLYYHFEVQGERKYSLNCTRNKYNMKLKLKKKYFLIYKIIKNNYSIKYKYKLFLSLT